MKSKRGTRGKSQPPVDEIIDELLCDDLDLIVDPDLHDEHLDEQLDQQLVETDDEIAIEPEVSDTIAEKEAGSKKRGRPKKKEADTTPKSRKQKEEPEE